MQRLFLVMVGPHPALTGWSLAVLPDKVAVYFGGSGRAAGWAPKGVNAPRTTGLHALFLILIRFAPRMVMLAPASLPSRLSKEYWVRPESRARRASLLRGPSHLFGAALFGFTFVVGLVALQANLSDPVRLSQPVFPGALGLCLLPTIWWSVAFVRRSCAGQSDPSEIREPSRFD